MTGLERLRELQHDVIGHLLLWYAVKPVKEIEDKWSADIKSKRTIEQTLGEIADQIESEQADDHEIAEWVRDNGGIDNIQDELANNIELVMIVRDALWPDGKVSCCENGNEQIADELDKRLMPPGMEWPKVDSKKVDFTTGYGPSLGVLEAVEIYHNGACNVMSHDGIVKSVSDIHIAKQDPIGADGLPIRNDETVWSVNTGEELIVVGFNGKYVLCRYEGVNSAIPAHGSWNPLELTHTKPEPPDSAERIAEDIKRMAEEWCSHPTLREASEKAASSVGEATMGVALSNLSKRCRALAERERCE